MPNELSIKVYNLTDLYKIIDEELESYVFTDNKFEENKKMRLLSKHYAGTDSFAYKNILQHLKRLPVQKSSVHRIDLKKELLTKLKKESSKRIYQVNTIVKQKFPDLTAAEIETFFLRLNQIESNKPRIKVRKLYDKLFEITSG